MADHDTCCERIVVGETTSGGGRLFPVGFMLCHCARRERLARGLASVPTDDLEWLPPECPNCAQLVDFDGDSLWCERCHLSWDGRGSGGSARFTDTYVETDEQLAEQASEWLRNYQSRHPEGASL